MNGHEFSRHNSETIHESSETPLNNRRCHCHCLFFPSSSVRLTWWRSIRTAEIERRYSLWARGVAALNKIREWSELIAGPRWKTFIRRFNRNRSGNTNHVNFQYDPSSYAMNFDEGPGCNSHFDTEEGDDGYYYGSRNFSSRYAKSSIDVGKDGPTFD